MKAIWLNDWVGLNKANLEKLFGLHSEELHDIDLLLASYKQEDDSGYGFILFRDAQNYYEVNVSNDSKIDLSGQWQPEETSIEVLLFRLNKGNLGAEAASENIFAGPLRELLARLLQ